ncbi:NAD(P)/FAD-dependent oxidoreductase [Aerococcaceae bacterium zg-BR33]|nr:NAD(P)/FAD-dependent oxidoreductase [Aerococcaceae bacterium zg-A91]MBS4458684.1 NAD(P)/FAD-dependent oxidoreductase [Aerococcaceae bacterium zg-BR33]
MELYDITIIGGGPVGLYTAFYAEMRQVKVKIIESLESLGGQPAHLYPEKTIYDIPGFPATTGVVLTQNLVEQLNRFDTTIVLGEKVNNIHKNDDDIFELTTQKGIHYSKSVIIAIGNGAFSPRRLNLPEASFYEGQNLHYYVNRLTQFENTDVVICGGGDSAVDWSLMLAPIAKSVTLLHRRPQFRAMEHSVSLLEQSSVNVLTPYIPTKIIGDQQQLSAIEITEVRGEKTIELPADHFIVSYGFSSSIGNIKDWGIATKGNKIPVSSYYETNVSGIFAVGDIASYDGKIDIIATGFGEGPTAVGNAISYFDPTRKRQHLHSTSLFEA